MPTQVACPKCNAKYKISEKMLGKVLQCQKCGAKFKLPAPRKAAAGAGQPVASQKRAANPAASREMKKYGLDGPIESSQNDIFDSPPTNAPVGDMLGNHALDPGFSSAASQKKSDDNDDESKVIFENPAIAKKKKKKKKADSIYEPSRQPLKDYDDEPFDFKKAVKEVWFILLLICFPMAVIGVLVPYFGGPQFSAVSLITRLIIAFISMGVSVWGLILVFQTSQNVVQLLLCLFVPFYILFFIAQNWAEMKKFVQAAVVTFVAQLIYVPFDLMGDGF